MLLREELSKTALPPVVYKQIPGEANLLWKRLKGWSWGSVEPTALWPSQPSPQICIKSNHLYLQDSLVCHLQRSLGKPESPEGPSAFPA